jgi:di/tricarboxylate transporter
MLNTTSLSEINFKEKKNYLDEIIYNLTYLSKINNYEIAKYISYFRIYYCNPNQNIYSKGEYANKIYWVLKGSVQLEDQDTKIQIEEKEAFGDESLHPQMHYFFSAKTLSKCVLLILDSKMAQSLILKNVQENYVLEKILTTISGKKESLVRHPSIKSHFEKIDSMKISLNKERKIKILGWILAIFLPLFYYFFTYENSVFYINWNTHIFISIFIAVLLMWAFRLISEYVTSIFAILSILILNVAPQNIVLSGFTDGSFYLALSIFTLSYLIVSSGFAYRIVLWLLRIVPLSTRWHSYSLFTVGLLLTPILPSTNGRVALIVPILKNFLHSIGLTHTQTTKKEEIASISKIITATFIGTTMFSTIFLSSKAIHFVIFGLLPDQIKDRFTWSYWLFASLVAGIIMIIGCILLLEIFYPKDKNPPITKKHIQLQYLALGKMNLNEYAALGGLLLFLIGIATSGLHKISLPWIGLMILYATLSLGFINHKQFRQSIDWTFLIFLASLIGFIKTFSYIGLDHIFSENLNWLGIYMQKNFIFFIVICLGVIFLMRLFIPTNSTVAILASILFPLAQIYGINVWVIGFILLMFSDMWFFPYQSTYYIQFENLLYEERYFNQKNLLYYNAIANIFRIIAVITSVYYWQKVGIL